MTLNTVNCCGTKNNFTPPRYRLRADSRQALMQTEILYLLKPLRRKFPNYPKRYNMTLTYAKEHISAPKSSLRLTTQKSGYTQKVFLIHITSEMPLTALMRKALSLQPTATAIPLPQSALFLRAVSANTGSAATTSLLKSLTAKKFLTNQKRFHPTMTFSFRRASTQAEKFCISLTFQSTLISLKRANTKSPFLSARTAEMPMRNITLNLPLTTFHPLPSQNPHLPMTASTWATTLPCLML